MDFTEKEHGASRGRTIKHRAKRPDPFCSTKSMSSLLCCVEDLYWLAVPRTQSPELAGRVALAPPVTRQREAPAVRNPADNRPPVTS